MQSTRPTIPFDDWYIGGLVHHGPVATLTKLANSLLERIWNVVTIKNDMDLITFLGPTVDDPKKMTGEIMAIVKPCWLSH